MNHSTHLQIAGVPEDLHAEALDALARAEQASEGLTKAKLKTRLLMAGKIARVLPWDAERLIDVKPEWAQHDVVRMLNITCNGDNAPWVETPEGGRPVQGHWLDPSPGSEEFQRAVASCYWCPGHHPRSFEARKAWYRRNGGEHLTWQRGEPINTANPVQEWSGTSGKLQVSVVRSGSAWIVATRKQLLGKLLQTGRYGFEADNVFCGPGRTQGWFPLPGVELRAPATWGSRLRWQKTKA